MDHTFGLHALKERAGRRGLREIEFDEFERGAEPFGAAPNLGDVGALDRGVVEGIEVVHADDATPHREQSLAQVRTDEAGGAGDDDRAGISHAGL
jgi:hypothetical protein